MHIKLAYVIQVSYDCIVNTPRATTPSVTYEPLTDSDETPEPAMLECRDIWMSFGGVAVLKGVSFAASGGTVTALAGENGAGKSTLMKIASGQYRPDKGHVLINGHELPVGNTQVAHKVGVAIVPQELASVMDLSVYENIFLGRELSGPRGLRRQQMIEQARENLKVFGVNISPTAMMRDLPVGVRQIVEIVKATNTGAQVILLDEPSSAIAKQEVDRLFTVIATLRERGRAILFTTHKMDEILAVSDRVVVLRDGGLVLDEPIEAVSQDDIVTAMIGRELEHLFPALPDHGDEIVLSVSDLTVQGEAEPISFDVRAGEIIGLAGQVGAGRTELLEGIFGVRPSSGGVISVSGRPINRNSPTAAIKAGLAMVPEDRKGAGLVLSMDVLDNTSLPDLSAFSSGGILHNSRRRNAVEVGTKSVQLRSAGLGQIVETLSGGNQQKVAFARWLLSDMAVLLLDEPTRGVDIGARSEIYRIITDLASRGIAVVMASSDMPEIVSLAHRALVLREGAVVAQLNRADLDSPLAQDRIFRLASGISASSADVQQGAASQLEAKD